MTPKLSIIIATYNSEKTLEKSLNSLFIQTYKDFEIIIIDGNSNDKTLNIIKHFEEKFISINIPFFWISEVDSGIYNAWNKGIKLTKSNWISFLGSDDTYYPDALENYIKEIRNKTNINYISSKVELINKNEEVVKLLKNPYNYKQLINYMDFAHVGSFHHKSLFEKFGFFNENYKICSDYDFFLKCGYNIKHAFLDKITAKMLNEGISNRNFINPLREMLNIQLYHKKKFYIHVYFNFYYAIIRNVINRIKIFIRYSFKK